MRKNFIFLLAIFVCALGFPVAFAQSDANTQTNNDVSVASSAKADNASEGTIAAALSASDIVRQIGEARRSLSTRQASVVSHDQVTLAAFDPATSETRIFSFAKSEFLVKDADLLATAQSGGAVRVHVVRANGVNTAVTVTDVSSGRSLVPLLVQFPIVKGGAVTEMAYYTSAHPALLSSAITSAGQTYVRQMLDTAAARMAQGGVMISPDIVDVAEHLCIVEHTDHKRFMNEDQTVLFPEILSLYALNEGNTFRYSVSTAGAGGMIQMIPQTYKGIRQQHPAVSLQPDFVTGMRDHANALEAMLLYMNDTWNKLAESAEVQNALRNGIATKPELLAAGYNSNPGRLPLYLKNGGDEWRTLIPAETQMYLKIYSAVDKTLDLGSDSSSVDGAGKGVQVTGSITRPLGTALVLSWLSQSLSMTSAFFGRIMK
ncbi:MAG: hypothetical protein QOH70_1906 [Blastocatellia bacterium]|jgi:hypothetical protein|nr:hypothetical protein [Blastocatellia bacterium]